MPVDTGASAVPPLQWRAFVPVALIWLCLLAFVTLLVVTLRSSYLMSEERLREQVLFSARLVESHAAVTFDRANQTLLDVIGHLRPSDLSEGMAIAESRRGELQAMLKEHALRFPAILSMALTDSDGTIFANSIGGANGTSVAGRDYFQALKNGPPDAVSISEALLGRLSNKWGVQIARGVVTPDGRFGGMLVASIGLDEGFVTFYKTLPLLRDDVLTLIDSNLRLLARFPVIEANLGKPVKSLNVQWMISTGVGEKVGVEKSPLDGVKRMVSIRKLTGFPVYLVYGRNVESAFQTWRYDLSLVIAGSVFAVVATILITTGLLRRERLAKSLAVAQASLSEALADSEQLALHDQLTGLLNRRAFDIRLQEAVARGERTSVPFSLLMLDLDFFKEINDTFGHIEGDNALIQFANLLRERLRQNDIVARWGGEEFVVIAEGANLEQARVLADKIRQAAAEEEFVNIGVGRTVSIGLAEYRRGQTESNLLKMADRAMYEAKLQGRNRVVSSQ